MSLKLKYLNNIRSLRIMARNTSSEELCELLQKLRAVTEERREEERQLQKQSVKQDEKINTWVKRMLADGIHPEELMNQYIQPLSGKHVKKRKARPAKYRFMDLNGAIKTWTGQGRMPKMIVRGLQQGKSLDDFLI